MSENTEEKQEPSIEKAAPEDSTAKNAVPDAPMDKNAIPEDPTAKNPMPDAPMDKNAIPEDPTAKKAAPDAPMDKKSTGAVDAPEVEQEFSQVATNPKQSIVILVGIGAVFLYLFFNLFMGDSSTDKNAEPTPMPDEITKPVQVSSDNDIPSIPTLPAPPKLEDPTPPPPPEVELSDSGTPPALPSIPTEYTTGSAPTSAPNDIELPFNNAQSDDSNKQQEEKRRSAIVLISGTPPSKTPDELQQEADFKFRGDLNFVLGRGKMLDAVIETAVNTDLGGEIRAVISRDVYSEQGKNILLPKGSRVFGNYATGTDGAYGRIAIEWTRVDLANGYTLNLSGTGMDSLGRKGAQGRIDNKFKEQFTNAVLRSAFNVTLARGLDSLVPPVTSTAATAVATQTATNVKNIATAILLDNTTYPNETLKVTTICAQTLAAITDQTSSLYTTINAACTAAYADDVAKLTAVMAAVNSGSDTAVQTAAESTTETQAQTATKQAYTDISDTIKTLVDGQVFTPTITIDQGTSIKIYVNKDYVFPKEAIAKKRLMK